VPTSMSSKVRERTCGAIILAPRMGSFALAALMRRQDFQLLVRLERVPQGLHGKGGRRLRHPHGLDNMSDFENSP
jgi:hypothetical protein